MHLRLARASAAILTALLFGCASTNGIAPRASIEEPDRLAAARTLTEVPVAPGAWPAADWWRAFGDPQLDVLIDEALTDSPTLRIAEARTREALAFAAESKAALYPQIQGSFAATRERFAENGLTPPPAAGTWQTPLQLQATLAWEIDFWGKNRAAYESALGRARAAEVDAAAARLALSTAVAQAYVALERAYLLQDVARATLAEREHIYRLTRDRNAAGIDSRLELKQAETAIPAAREEIARLQETIDVTRNQIASLLGQGPDRGLAITRPTAATLPAVALPATVPAELLGRRPDLVAQRWRVEAASKDIAVAKAEFYPNVNLLAFIGLQSIGPAGFLTAASRTMGAGPAVTLPIFEGGRLRANLAGRDAGYDVAVEQYNRTLVDALRDVVDQLAAWRSVETQRAEQKTALTTAQEAYDLALLRYREGIGNYLQVLSAESPLRTRELASAIGLTRALGGGIDIAAADAPPAH
jgi:NodT family efflux transporter outer membrane factor (OMF) lipoprotein